MSLRSDYVTKPTRLALYANTNFSCAYCDEPIERDVRELSLDHVQPRSKGGDERNVKNIVCSCRKCNNKKGKLTLSQYARLIGMHPKKLKNKIRKITHKPLDRKTAAKTIKKCGWIMAVATF